ncbi:CatB-related O-acetyltransferase [Streptococcus pseudoporcinus]|uniref:Bacterial transferase hexapeptide repeat protein n=1 Tax=Streptococcus pseudoporcinus LQ 940-04 TaxID=875093 RepID=G5KAI2_9STRE|nr:CatB-related O-acetyltransferase [Streptococcus pseudoporcinus]EFR44685.1 bacterial transferase hexapeptide repeat protein [Streptococcus pseudoporcinus SPIN 20026]EHI65328.1 bacterial transferase hexapeptide repeat protein [Streptococcus pseudoporcinus LQ 940-04]VEF93064.1 acetyl transferase [Streptococcus pseudoporcinus]
MINLFISRYAKFKNQREWRKANSHNKTVLGSVSNYHLISVGKFTYGVLNIINHSDNYKLKIGHFCSIAPNVQFIVCGEHLTNKISTYPFRVRFLNEKYEAVSNGDIIIEDDVWIGTNAIILSGVTIGKGAVIAAGSVVTKDVPPYTIYGGVPAKLIKKRFSDKISHLLMKLDYSKLSENTVRENIELFYSDLDKNPNLPKLENLINKIDEKELK